MATEPKITYQTLVNGGMSPAAAQFLVNLEALLDAAESDISGLAGRVDALENP